MAEKKQKTFFRGAKDYGKKENITLYFKAGSKDGTGIKTNVQPWKKDWLDVRIHKYDSKFHQRLLNMDENPVEETLEEEMQAFQDQAELPIDPRFFVPTDVQQAELDAFAGAGSVAARAARRVEMENIWILQRINSNVTIKSTNEINKAQRSLIVKKFMERSDKKSELWGDICASIEKESLEKIKTYVEGEEGEDNYLTYDIALERWEWLYLFRAAEHTHLMLDDMMDPFTRDMRRRQEVTNLELFKQGTIKYEKWVNLFEEKVRLVRLCGQELTDRDIIHYFMTGLNPILFKQQLEQWNVPSLRSGIPEDFEELKARIKRDYDHLCITQGSLVDRVYNSARNQGFNKSFVGKVEESKVTEDHKESKDDYKRTVNGQKACYICGSYGKHFHVAKKCRFYNDKFSLEANRKYCEDRKKSNDGKTSISETKITSNTTGGGKRPSNDPSVSDVKESKVNMVKIISIDDLDVKDMKKNDVCYVNKKYD